MRGEMTRPRPPFRPRAPGPRRPAPPPPPPVVFRVWHTELPSPIGVLQLYATARGLVTLAFPNQPRAEVEDQVRRAVAGEGGTIEIVEDAAPFAVAREQLAEYFAGTRREFTVPLDLRGTPFFRQVWDEVKKIPYGETRSYLEVAKAVGLPTGVRAVGLANGANPIPLLIPCHRVIGSNGALVGYGGGLPLKARLLAWERGQGGLW
jgi:methylated-DNA-[protein]-cysteine S-methyltransferase